MNRKEFLRGMAAVVGSLGVLAVVAMWPRWFPALARRDRLQPDGTPRG
jgi:hypothetical protein